MNGSTETVDSMYPHSKADMMRQDKVSQEREAIKSATIITALGIGIFVLCYYSVRLINYPENRREKRAIELVKNYRLGPNERNMEEYSQSAVIEAGGRFGHWGAKRVPGKSNDRYQVKFSCLNKSNQWRSWTFECLLASGHVKPLGFTRLESRKTNGGNGSTSGRPVTKNEPNGKVTAIAYSTDKPSAVMGNAVVHEGDTIHDVKVVKIERRKVHFEKNGRTWSQGVGGAPASHWK